MLPVDNNHELLNNTMQYFIRRSENIECSEVDLQTKIEKIATIVAKLYSIFPMLNNEQREELKKSGFKFTTVIKVLQPSMPECLQFEAALKKRIIADLTQEIAHWCFIELSTNYHPEGALKEVAESSFPKKYLLGLGLLFPFNTRTKISLVKEKSQLSLNTRLI